MTAQELKNSILQLAVQGKLIRNDESIRNSQFVMRNEEAITNYELSITNYETGAQLLERIRKEKATIKNIKGVKKEKDLPPIAEDEKPFDIPENWCWCRLGELGTFVRGSGIKRNETVENGFPCIRYGEMYTTYKTKFSKTKSFIPKDIFDNCHKVNTNDICMALTGENKFDIALAALYEGTAPIAMGGDMTKFSSYFCFPLYLVYVINSSYGINCKRKLATGDIICHISNDKLASIPIPLPPLSEQKAIVAKIEELLPYIEKYNIAYTKLEEFNKKFPEDMQKSILQQAVQGKLIHNSQCVMRNDDEITNYELSITNYETGAQLLERIRAEKQKLIAQGKIKKEKDLPPITEDEIPFEIPENWCWCRLGEICNEIRRGKSPKYAEKSNYLAFAQKCNVKAGGINLDLALYLDESTISRYSETDNMIQDDVVINSTGGGTMGRVGFYECEVPENIKGVYPDSHVTVIRSIGGISQKYLYFFLKSKQADLEKMGAGSTNQTELKPATLQNLPIPLPPLAEQKRIVAKIEELLPLCKKLIRN